MKFIRIEPTTEFTLNVFKTIEDAYMHDVAADSKSEFTTLNVKAGEFMEVELMGYEFTTDTRRYDNVRVVTGMKANSIRPTVFAYKLVSGWCKRGDVKFNENVIDQKSRYVDVDAVMDSITNMPSRGGSGELP